MYKLFAVYKTGILQIFSLITGDETFFFSTDIVKLNHKWELTFRSTSSHYLDKIYHMTSLLVSG